MEKKQEAKEVYLVSLAHLLEKPKQLIQQTINEAQEGMKHGVQGQLFEEDVG